ncbi:MAG: hypothetical protein P9M14_09250 [Candidatus Alcyoniella australis]|nr:hypothetical protein [Candidatus Alcyoniella australis]
MNRSRLLNLCWPALALILICGLLSFAACQEDEDKPDVWHDDDSGDDDDDDDAWTPPTCELAQVPALPLPERASPNVITFDETGRMSINGQPFFPWGFYGVDHEDGSMDELAAIGFNNAETSSGCCQGEQLQEHIDYINAAQDAGLFAWVKALKPTSQLDSVPRATLEDYITQRSELPGLMGWYTFDEPGLHGVDVALAQELNDLFNEVAPTIPTTLVMMASVPYETYIDYCNVFMVDPYPVPFMPIGLVTTQIQGALEAAQGRGANGGVKPVWGVLQAFDWQLLWGTKPVGEPWRPTPDELRNMAYQAVAAGAQGVVYWNYSHLRASESWEGFQVLARQITSLNAIWVSDTLDSSALMPGDQSTSTVVTRLFQFDGRHYLLAVNNGLTSTSATFDISSLGDNPCAIDYFDEQVRLVSREGTFTEIFENLGVRLFQITDEAKGGCR